MNIPPKYQVVIGLEVHAQLLTKSKLFCSDSTTFGAGPNTQVSPISLAHPGTLPVMNRKAIELAVTLGLALHCEIERFNYFARKNYFYPDLPKGYQVSQHTAPICKGGHVSIQTNDGSRNIRLNRIHIEEDAGKSIHDADEHFTCIDLNRAGVPLLEIVTEPDLHSADEAFAFLTELRKIVRWLHVCDGNMEEGSMRCDANVSVRLHGETKLGKRVEVKNLNSIRNVKRAIEIEANRLIGIMEQNENIIQETRSYDADRNLTFSLRSKEEADDYRYFPEPDLPPFNITDDYIHTIAAALPALPEQVKQQYIRDYQLTTYDAITICNDKEDVDFFESLRQYTSKYKAIANWLLGPLKSYCNEHGISITDFPVPHKTLSELISLVEEGQVSFSNASTKILQALISDPSASPLQIAKALNVVQENDSSAIEQWVTDVLHNMPGKVAEYKSGKKGLIGLFAGEVKKMSKGKADMQLVNKMLTEKLNQ
ncbi:MAG: Asp-tRNA(Asn)/Glu-tRNA(Gln) amidotransferase subunit GatB [Bacteroidetes bacterium]|nr:Asp-tRNA(Asn)/Glu-tRNA(Gln) amidotransferase subunit GatB [Bacteroidota bacterium]